MVPVFCKKRQKVYAGNKLISFGQAKIAAAGHPDVVVILVSDSGNYKDLAIQVGACKALEPVITV